MAYAPDRCRSRLALLLYENQARRLDNFAGGRGGGEPTHLQLPLPFVHVRVHVLVGPYTHTATCLMQISLTCSPRGPHVQAFALTTHVT